MKYCRYCGQEIVDDAVICVHCGRSLRSNGNFIDSITDTGSIGWAFLGFFVPIVGLILFLLWKDERPLNAKMAGKGALINVIVGVSASVIAAIIVVVVLSASFASIYGVGALSLLNCNYFCI